MKFTALLFMSVATAYFFARAGGLFVHANKPTDFGWPVELFFALIYVALGSLGFVAIFLSS